MHSACVRLWITGCFPRLIINSTHPCPRGRSEPWWYIWTIRALCYGAYQVGVSADHVSQKVIILEEIVRLSSHCGFTICHNGRPIYENGHKARRPIHKENPCLFCSRWHGARLFIRIGFTRKGWCSTATTYLAKLTRHCLPCQGIRTSCLFLCHVLMESSSYDRY